MRILFYAPMKPPDSEKPSGDRTFARLILAALRHGGCDVRLASRLRTWQRHPDQSRRAAIIEAGRDEADAIVAAYTSPGDNWQPDAWLTYHVYYRAPDDIGPEVASRLGIPYAIAEASYSPKRDTNEWAVWQAAAVKALRASNAIFCVTQRDRSGLEPVLSPNTRLINFPPFVDLAPFATPEEHPRRTDAAHPVRLTTVAMMRDGAKLKSYQFLAAALSELEQSNWRLEIIGDGVARGEVEAAFDALPSERITWSGLLQPDAVRARLAKSDLFVWPGFDEAFGMVYLEAQAAGVPVVGLDTAGVSAVVCENVSGRLVAEISPKAFADAASELIGDLDRRNVLAQTARTYVARHHDIAAAAHRLIETLQAIRTT